MGCCRNPARFRTSGKIRGCARSTLCPRSATTPDSTARASAHRFGFACTDSRLGRPPPDPLPRPVLHPGPAAAGHAQPPWEHPVGPAPLVPRSWVCPLRFAERSVPLSVPLPPEHLPSDHPPPEHPPSVSRSPVATSPPGEQFTTEPFIRALFIHGLFIDEQFICEHGHLDWGPALAARLRPAGTAPVTDPVALPVPRRTARSPAPWLPATARPRARCHRRPTGAC